MSEFITPKVDAPPPRNLTAELDAINKAYLKYAPGQYDLEAKYSGPYNRLAIQNLGESVQGYTDAQGVYHPGTIALNTDANAANRAADIADVSRLGPAARDAYLAANPWLARSLNSLESRTADSPLLRTLNQQAEAGLAGGGQLSPQEIRQLTQESRAGFADRGMLGGNQSLAAEVLSRDAAVRGRMAAAQQFATGVQGLNSTQNQFVNQATGTFASALNDPYASVLSRTGGAGATQNNAKTYNPTDLGNYGQSLFGQNYAAGVQLGIENARQQQDTRDQIAKGFGFSDRRLKRNIVYVGSSPSGLPIYEFDYIPDADLPTGRWRGTIAQEIQPLRPDAVTRGRDGYLRVLYYKLDLKLVPAPEPLAVLQLEAA